MCDPTGASQLGPRGVNRLGLMQESALDCAGTRMTSGHSRLAVGAIAFVFVLYSMLQARTQRQLCNSFRMGMTVRGLCGICDRILLSAFFYSSRTL